MRLLLAIRLVQKIGQVIGIVVGRIEKAAFRDAEFRGVDRAAAGVPSERTLSGDLGVDADGLGDGSALDIFRHVPVFDPLQTVRGNFPFRLHHRLHLVRGTLHSGWQRHRWSRATLARGEHAVQTPEASARAIFVD